MITLKLRAVVLEDVYGSLDMLQADAEEMGDEAAARIWRAGKLLARRRRLDVGNLGKAA